MSVSAVIKPPEKPSDREKAALISLLVDEDAAIYRLVRDKILSCGPGATEWLKPHTLSSDPVLRRRAQEITQHFAREKADDRFLAFCGSRAMSRIITTRKTVTSTAWWTAAKATPSTCAWSI